MIFFILLSISLYFWINALYETIRKRDEEINTIKLQIDLHNLNIKYNRNYQDTLLNNE
jgi:hypothetical protein